MRQEIGEGLRFLRRDAVLFRLTISIALANLAWYAVQAVMVPFATRDLQLSPAMLGLALGATGPASLLGALVAARSAHRFGLGPTLVASLMGEALSRVVLLAAGGPAGGGDGGFGPLPGSFRVHRSLMGRQCQQLAPIGDAPAAARPGCAASSLWAWAPHRLARCLAAGLARLPARGWRYWPRPLLHWPPWPACGTRGAPAALAIGPGSGGLSSS